MPHAPDGRWQNYKIAYELICVKFSAIIIVMKTPEQKKYYEQATKNILAQLQSLNMSPEKYANAANLVKRFREAFTKDEVKKATFITPDSKIWDLGYDSGGFCRVASISFAIATDFHDWQLMAIDGNQWHGKMGHHWLKHVPTGKVFDITYDQFTVDGLKLPYHLGKPAAYALSLQDETHKFAKCVDLNIIKLLMEDKSK